VSNKRLWHFSFNQGRGYRGDGLFWAYPEEVKRLIGRTISLGEVCGKHSEVEVTLTKEMVRDVTEEIKDDSFSIGLNLLRYGPRFDYILVDGMTRALYPEDVLQPNDIRFDPEQLDPHNKSYSNCFYDIEEINFYEVYKSENIGKSLVYFARPSKD
jgi:hypothetical protein